MNSEATGQGLERSRRQVLWSEESAPGVAFIVRHGEPEESNETWRDWTGMNLDWDDVTRSLSTSAWWRVSPAVATRIVLDDLPVIGTYHGLVTGVYHATGWELDREGAGAKVRFDLEFASDRVAAEWGFAPGREVWLTYGPRWNRTSAGLYGPGR